jgi:hypothetical protein
MKIIYKSPPPTDKRQDIIRLDINSAIRLHPVLEVLNNVNFMAWYDFKFKSFYIEYGRNLEKSILTKDVLYIKEEIDSYTQEEQ